MKDKAWPALVRIGDFHVPILMNRKAYHKSLENNCPWIVHPVTERVLPWPGNPNIIRLEEGPSCYLMELLPGTAIHPYGEANPPNFNPDERTVMKQTGEDLSDETSYGVGGNIHNTLSQVVEKRRRDMPDGSYTAHLFDSGPDKIRKKLGEEAVELILARENRDVIYESVDLLYHLQVLLAELEISWDEVEAELHRRLIQE